MSMTERELEDARIFAKCTRRLLPFMALLYVVNFLDRVNVGFAALTMNRDLGFSPAVFGLGAGVFFVGYLLFQVTGNLMLERLGARRWVFFIVAVWGLISSANALAQGPRSFYALRFLLGAAEAGFFPGMVLYLTYWFPRAYRARLTATFMAAIPFASIFGGPLSGLVLGLDGTLGLKGWQWMFVLEGLPAFLLAFGVLKILPDGPRHASWLDAEEKRAIEARLAADDDAAHRDLWSALRQPRVFALGIVYWGYAVGAYGVQLWLPQIVSGMGFSNLATGFVVASPFLVAMPVMILWGRSSDRAGERIWHVALPALVAVAGLIAASLTQNSMIVFAGLASAIIGLLAIQGPFWALPSSFLGGTAAAGGIALINTLGTGLGGFAGPTILGFMKERTGDYAAGMAVLAIGPALTAIVVLMLGRARLRSVALAPDKT
jgi:ACS family tartrate transporter-like MFS transporter